jgi:copper resistance protein B
MKRATMMIALPLLAVPATAMAQQHDHDPQAAEPQSQAGQAAQDDVAASEAHDHHAPDQPQMDHSRMQHPREEVQDPEVVDHSAMDHGAAQHGAMPMTGKEDEGGMSQMDHSAMGHGASADHMAIPEGPPPPEALQGPAFAADAFVGAEEMAASRAAVTKEVSGTPVFWFQGDRLEYRLREGDDGYLWDVQGYYGGDYNKFWFKSEGEGSFGETIESAEVQALWSRAIAPFFDFQAGVRQDFTGPERTHAVVGIQGLVPYEFEVDAAAFVSTKGDVTARIEGELDQRITQRLILQPRAELALSAQDIPELGIGAGLDRIEAGLRLRYEFAREFAPYVGVSQEWRIGDSADYARAAGEDPSVTNYVVGVRFWF